MLSPERLLTASEVAQVLAVPRSSVYEYARRQRDGLPSIRIGRHRRFVRRDVEAWIEELRGAARS
jgi:excisionase family DNA binding protein